MSIDDRTHLTVTDQLRRNLQVWQVTLSGLSPDERLRVMLEEIAPSYGLSVSVIPYALGGIRVAFHCGDAAAGTWFRGTCYPNEAMKAIVRWAFDPEDEPLRMALRQMRQDIRDVLLGLTVAPDGEAV